MVRRTAAQAGGQDQRQLRVGELVRGALVDALAHAHFRDPVLIDAPITVTEARMSPDLQHARVYVMPLGGRAADEMLAALNRATGYLRLEVTRRVRLRVSPTLQFELDRTFDEAARIDALLRSVGRGSGGSDGDAG
jgi:ribosome-binding factor A